MKYSIKDLKAYRQFQNMQLQHEYDKLPTYKDKLSYIYNLLYKTQSQLEKEYKGTFFKENNLEKLLALFEQKNIKDNASFVKFVNDNIVSKTVSPHNRLKEIPKEKEPKVNNPKPNSSNEEKSSLEKNQKENNVEYNFENKTLVLKIKSFKSKFLKEDSKIFEEIKSQLKEKDCDNVIIDIRGNGGGTDEYFSLLSLFTNKDIVENISYIDSLTNEGVETQVVSIDGNKNAKNYDRYLLVDDKVFSSADGLTRLCKNTGFATVIGEKTRGEGIGLTPFDLKIATANDLEQEKYNIQGVNMQFSPERPIENDSYATTPDIICDAQQAKEVALNQIKQKEQLGKLNFER